MQNSCGRATHTPCERIVNSGKRQITQIQQEILYWVPWGIFMITQISSVLSKPFFYFHQNYLNIFSCVHLLEVPPVFRRYNTYPSEFSRFETYENSNRNMSQFKISKFSDLQSIIWNLISVMCKTNFSSGFPKWHLFMHSLYAICQMFLYLQQHFKWKVWTSPSPPHLCSFLFSEHLLSRAHNGWE